MEQPSVLDIEAINPKRHSKYSANLYKWLKQSRNVAFNRTRVFLLPDDDGQYISWKPRQILIGSLYDGCVGGRRLSDILCGSRGVFSNTYCYPPAFKFIDITDEFWSEYIRDGRCAIDRSHIGFFSRDESRYQHAGSTRKCRWCGKWFNKVIRKQVTVQRLVEWEAA